MNNEDKNELYELMVGEERKETERELGEGFTNALYFPDSASEQTPVKRNKLKKTLGTLILAGAMALGLSDCAVKQELCKPTPIPEKQYHITMERPEYTLNLEFKDEWLITRYQSDPDRAEDIIERHLGPAMGDIQANEIFDGIFKLIDYKAMETKIDIIKEYMRSQTEDNEEINEEIRL